MKRTWLYAFAKTVAQWFVIPFLPYHVNDKDRFPKEGRVIVCCNHLGMSDCLRLAFTQKRQIYYMGKAELFENKFVSFVLRSLGAFPVQRGKHDVGAIDICGDLLGREEAVGIFPEGTRSRDGKFLPFKAGAVMLALKHNTPILPVCITPVKGMHLHLFHRVVISYGDLIQPSDLGIERGSGTELRAASRMVQAKIQELRDRDLIEMGRQNEIEAPRHNVSRQGSESA